MFHGQTQLALLLFMYVTTIVCALIEDRQHHRLDTLAVKVQGLMLSYNEPRNVTKNENLDQAMNMNKYSKL